MFSVYVAVSKPLFIPNSGITVSHSALSLTIQVTFEVRSNVVLPAVFSTVLFWGSSSKLSLAFLAACVTVTVLVIPPPLISIVPFLEVFKKFLSNVAISVSFPNPLLELTVNQVALSLTVQFISDVTINIV